MNNLDAKTIQASAVSGRRPQESRLREVLARVQRRQLLLDSAKGWCWGLLGSLVDMLLAMWLDLVWELAPLTRVFAWGGAALVFLAVIFYQLFQTRLSLRSHAVARQIDSTSGFQGEWLNGLNSPPFTPPAADRQRLQA